MFESGSESWGMASAWGVTEKDWHLLVVNFE